MGQKPADCRVGSGRGQSGSPPGDVKGQSCPRWLWGLCLPLWSLVPPSGSSGVKWPPRRESPLPWGSSSVSLLAAPFPQVPRGQLCADRDCACRPPWGGGVPAGASWLLRGRGEHRGPRRLRPGPSPRRVAEVREEQAGRVLISGQGRHPWCVPGCQAGLGPSPCFCPEACGARPDVGCAVHGPSPCQSAETFCFPPAAFHTALPLRVLTCGRVCRADWPVHARAAFLSNSAHKQIPRCPRRPRAARKLASLHPELGPTSPAPVFTCWPLLGGEGLLPVWGLMTPAPICHLTADLVRSLSIS